MLKYRCNIEQKEVIAVNTRYSYDTFKAESAG